MGIEYNAIQFLRFAKKRSPFGKVATIGRQSLDIPVQRLRQLLSLPAIYKHEQFADNFLIEHFGATSVESFDHSDYEGANYIEDLNKPLIRQYPQFNTILDFGTLEHIYNVPQAFKNLSELCAPGGQILHILPANNLSGHGFWQFSPELFFSLYSPKNGYTETQVFLSDISQQRFWHQITPPQNGQRIELNTLARLYILVRTLKGPTFTHESVQQSDYLVRWEDEASAPTAQAHTAQSQVEVKKHGRPVRHDKFTRAINAMRYLRASLNDELTLRGSRPEITRIPIESLL